MIVGGTDPAPPTGVPVIDAIRFGISLTRVINRLVGVGNDLTAAQYARFGAAGGSVQPAAPAQHGSGRFQPPTYQFGGQPVSRNEAVRISRTPVLNPTAPPPPLPTGGEILADLLNRPLPNRVLPRESEFDRLLRLPRSPPTSAPVVRTPVPADQGPHGNQAITEEAYAQLGMTLFDVLIRQPRLRREAARRGKGPKRRPRIRAWPDSARPPDVPQPPPAYTAPPALPAPARPAPRSVRVPSAQPERARPVSTQAVNYRVPAPATGPIRSPSQQSRPAVQPAPAPRPLPSRAPAPRPALASLLQSLPLPLLLSSVGSSPTRSNLTNTAGMTNILAPAPAIRQRPAPLTALQTQPLPSKSNCECRPKPTRSGKKKCTNPVISTRKQGKYLITTRELKCP